MLKKMCMMGLALTLAAAGAFAEEAATEEKAAEAPASVEATITGDSFCVSCKLSSSGVPVTGHLAAVKIKTATDKDGNEIADMAGKVLYVVPTEGGTALAPEGELSGKHVKVTGTVYPEMMAVQVASAEEAAAGGDLWDDWDEQGVGSMSGQPVL